MTLDELLNLSPSELAKLSNTELESILSPYYTAARQALLPPHKPQKQGLDYRLISAYIEANKDKLGIKIPTTPPNHD